MEVKTTKRSYYLPDCLVEYFTEWSKPGREYSPAMAGAMLVWMALTPEIRQKAKMLSQEADLAGSVDIIKKALRESFANQDLQAVLESLPDEKKRILAVLLKEAVEKVSQSL